MRILVSAASRHGGTAEVAHAIATALARAGIDVDEQRPEIVGHLNAYDGVVLGSAVYAGHWLKPAKDLVERTSAQMRARPVWLFSTGPVGFPLKPEGSPVDVAPMLEQSGGLEHRIFGGRLDKGELGFGEKVLVQMTGATEGDYRSWDDIEAWATQIASTLTTGRTTALPDDPQDDSPAHRSTNEGAIRP
jgi:menaquinone-dependent protoporphyrinogen oxidase